jgi:trimethylamine--corrinoid protein Co-methyltransferase
MRPQVRLLDNETIERILGEAFTLLRNPGVRVGSSDAVALLKAQGILVRDGVAQIPEKLARLSLASVPSSFALFNRAGEAVVHYGGDEVHFDPGSSCVQLLDPHSGEVRRAATEDLVRIVQVTEMLPQYAAQSTAVVCSDVPQEMGDIHRLRIVLEHSQKPIVTGSFSSAGLRGMIDLLIADSEGADYLRAKPRAVFDVCPSPPLHWSEFGAQNLVELARAGVPAEIVSMPIAGGAAPVTLAGSITQHAAEAIAGITIHQLACAGAPIVWGGAPAILDMRTGSAPMGAIETVMLNMGCAEVGKALGLPTHGYLVASDAKGVDEQCGAESARSAILGSLTGINMISGAGMLDSLATFSIEKLVLDAESIASAQRLLRGVDASYASFAAEAFSQTGLSGEFLKLPETRKLFRQEQHIPSSVIDRASRRDGTQIDALRRAAERVNELIAQYRRPEISGRVLEQFALIMEGERERRCSKVASA